MCLEHFLEVGEAREVGTRLAEAMAGGPLDAAPLWHAGFLLAWRAEHLGAETAARDREWAARRGWTADFWDEDGRLRSPEYLEMVTLKANREAWREEVGLPDGVAPVWP